MFLKLVAGLVLLVCIFSVGYTIYFYTKKAWLSGKKNLDQVKHATISVNDVYVIMKNIKKLTKQQVITFILDLIKLNSRNKLIFLFYALSMSAILIIPTRFFHFSRFTTWLGFFFILITLLGIAKFLGKQFKGHCFEKIIFYFLKLCIFLVYSWSFFLVYLQCLNNNILFIVSLLTTIVFSIYFLKGVFDGSNLIGFCIINFLFVYLYDLLAIGLHFGFFYLQNNEVFNLYTGIQQYDTFFDFLSITQIGLLYFYSLPNSGFGINSLINFVPFFEYVFGAVFNAGIIGFFISYIASKKLQMLDKEKS